MIAARGAAPAGRPQVRRGSSLLRVARSFTIVPRGPFSLERAAGFGFGPTTGAAPGDLMRLAFPVDDFAGHAGVVLHQDAAGVHAEVEGEGDLDAVRAQVARTLSLDHDGEAWLEVGRRDPVVARLQAEYAGLRPVLFGSPYEAAAWSIVSARRQTRQSAAVRRRLGEEHGRVFTLAGEELAAFPLPAALLELDAFRGLDGGKVERLHAVARAALDGRLDPERLRAMDPDAALADLRTLPGIGPFYAGLIVVRALGLADVLPAGEPRVLAAAAHHYGLDAPPEPAAFAALAEPWRPFRTWAAVLLRVSGDRAGVA